MTERVVVALEPVEVEDDENEGRSVQVGAGPIPRVCEELPAVAEPVRSP